MCQHEEWRNYEKFPPGDSFQVTGKTCFPSTIPTSNVTV